MHWLARAHNQHHPFVTGHLHLDKGELYTKQLRAYCSGRGIEVHVNARSAHEHNAKGERPIRTINEMARAIMTFGGADHVDYFPVGVACAVQILGVLPPMRRMYPKTKDLGDKRSRPLTPNELWTGDLFPNYRSQMRHLITPFCECTAILDVGQRGGKHKNPGEICLYLGPAHNNDTTERSFLVARYLDGKRFRVRHVIPNEDRLPLRDGPSPGIYMCPTLGGRRGKTPLEPHAKNHNELLLKLSSLSQPDNQTLAAIPEHEDIVEWESDTESESDQSVEEAILKPKKSKIPKVTKLPEVSKIPKGPMRPEPPLLDTIESAPTPVSPSTVPPEIMPILETIPMPPLDDLVLYKEEGKEHNQAIDQDTLKGGEVSTPEQLEPEVVSASSLDKLARARKSVKGMDQKKTDTLKPLRRSTRYSKSSLTKSNQKLYPPGTEIQTLWGPATVKKANSDNLNLAVWWHAEPSAVYTVKGTQIWLEDDKPGLLYDINNNIIRKQFNEINYVTIKQRSHDRRKAMFRGFHIDDLVGNVTALEINDALPKH